MARIWVQDDDAAAAPLAGGMITRPQRSHALRRRRNFAGLLLGIATIVGVVIASVHFLRLGIQQPFELQEAVDVPKLVGAEALEALCRAATLHRDVCTQTLLPNYRAHSATAEELIGILVASAAQGVAHTLAAVLVNRGVNRLGFSGERVCHSTLVSSIEQLDTALAALKSQPHNNSFEEIQTRLRAAAEFHTTCIDALVATRALEPRTADAEQRAEKLLANAKAAVAALSRFGPDLLSLEPTDDDDDDAPDRGGGGSEEALAAWWTREEIVMDAVDPPIDVLVAKDGSGSYKSIQSAVNAAPWNATTRYVIGIKAGVYAEQVIVPKTAKNLMFLGDGAGRSILTGNWSVATMPGMTTFFSPTLIVEGAGFIGKGFTARNTAAAARQHGQQQQQQAVAMRVSADMAAFQQCAFEGGQDALHTHTFRQLYRHCTIAGTVDHRFVLSNHGAVTRFQSCSMVLKN